MIPPPTAELRHLVDRLLDQDGLGRVESARLEELLDDPDALRYYTELVAQEALMSEALEGIESIERVQESRHFPWKPVTLATAAAAACVVAWLQFSGTTGRSVPGTAAFHESDVRMVALMGVEWKTGASPVLPDGSFATKQVVMRAGLAELEYPNGVRVILEGPADFTIDGATSGSLAHGRLVAHVPPEGVGFAVNYENGRVVDLGTEFGLAVNNRKMELSVFEGAVDLHLTGGSSRTLRMGQAVAHDGEADDPLRDIPLAVDRFARGLPTGDLPWQVDASVPGAIEFDVTRHIIKPSDYLMVFKWLDGWDAIQVGGVELRLNGRTVASDPQFGVTGSLGHLRDNTFRFNVAAADFAPGRWTLHAAVKPHPTRVPDDSHGMEALARGVLLVTEGFTVNATADDFIGRWSYDYENRHYVREFHPDGTASLVVNGQPIQHFFDNSQWTVEDGVLRLWLPYGGYHETHILRDSKTLVFISNPYEDAVKLESE